MKRKISELSCWIVGEGLAGTENQCIAVAEALGVSFDVKRISLRQPWKTLSPYLGFEQGWSFSPALHAPWPDLVIAAGRKGIAAARYIKHQSGGKTFTVFLQDPRISASEFDLVAVPEHDDLRGENVIVTAGSPNRVSAERLAAAHDEFASFDVLASPRVAVLIGGSSKVYTLTQEIVETLARQLSGLDAGLMVTTSRRTGKKNEEILQSALKHHSHSRGEASPRSDSGNPEEERSEASHVVDPVRASASAEARQRDDGGFRDVFIWNGNGANPYFGMLAWADYILVSADSASMLSDACSTGKPVYMIDMPKAKPAKQSRIDKFHAKLQNIGAMRIFDGFLERWEYEALSDARMVAREIKEKMNLE